MTDCEESRTLPPWANDFVNPSGHAIGGRAFGSSRHRAYRTPRDVQYIARSP